MRSRGSCCVHRWAERGTHWQTWVTCFFPPSLSLCLCRSGSLKARLCSTWSAASAWTVRPPPDPRSLRSVAPRWLDSPGSHRLSPDAQWDGDGRWWTLRKDSGEHVCTLGQKKGVRTVLLWCHQTPPHWVLLEKTSPRRWGAKTHQIYLCTELHLCRMLQFFYLIWAFHWKKPPKTVAYLTFIHFCILSWSLICFKTGVVSLKTKCTVASVLRWSRSTSLCTASNKIWAQTPS